MWSLNDDIRYLNIFLRYTVYTVCCVSTVQDSYVHRILSIFWAKRKEKPPEKPTTPPPHHPPHPPPAALSLGKQNTAKSPRPPQKINLEYESRGGCSAGV